MKVIFTFEYADLLDQIEKTLALNGVKPLFDAEGNKLIKFDHRKKEVVIHCEAAPIPEVCPFCLKANVVEETNTVEEVKATSISPGVASESEPEAVEEEENIPMSMAELRAQSNALASRKPKAKTAKGAQAHAALVTPSRLEGEVDDPPFNPFGDD